MRVVRVSFVDGVDSLLAYFKKNLYVCNHTKVKVFNLNLEIDEGI